MNAKDRARLTVSVGGSKCALAVVGGIPPRVLARSRRIEWTRERIQSIQAFVVMLAREAHNLLEQSGILVGKIGSVHVAWPGPRLGENFEATFIPGCQQPQPIPHLLRSALSAALGPTFETVPVCVLLDAVARAAGETQPGGALVFPTANGLLVNIATGIAGGIVRQGQALIQYPEIGANYGQFGRFLFYNVGSGDWNWRSTPDGSVPPHAPDEVRWTCLSAGPALAHRIARRCYECGFDTRSQPRNVVEALQHYRTEFAPRNESHEMVLLSLATAEINQQPEAPLARWVRQVAGEIGAALNVLVRVFASEQIDTIALAGGVGENFGRNQDPGIDPFLASIQQAMERNTPRMCRARLGVDAEFLGLASDAFTNPS